MGWDDNGLPTERRVQNYFGVRCDPTLPTTRPSTSRRWSVPMTRRPSRSPAANFIELCERLTRRGREGVRVAVPAARAVGGLDADLHDDRRASRAVPRSGASCGWPRKGLAYTAEAPTMWDVDFQHRGRPGRDRGPRDGRPLPPHRVRSARTAGTVEIETSRPELIPACVALVVHPSDERYARARRPDRAHAVVPGAGAGGRARACRSREGHGHRDDLHVRRRDRRDVVARAGPAGAGRDPPRRHADRGALRRARLGVARTRGRRTRRWPSSPARRRSRRGAGSSSCCARAARCWASPSRSATSSSSTRRAIGRSR